MTDTTIGVDISKGTLDAHRLPDGDRHCVPNSPAGHRALIAWIGPEVARVVFEPTGPYHAAFERALARRGLPLVKVNPRQARRFAEATGTLAKTDPLDTALLARMGALLTLEPRSPQTEGIADLKQLHIAREALVKDRTAAKNRAKSLRIALLKRQSAERLKHIERQLAAVEAEIESRIQADEDLARRFDILVSIPGIARLIAFVMLIEMPELGTMEAGQAASLAGLAPVTRQSGRWTGRAFSRGGRANVRRALYMPALVAVRFNPDMKAKYDALVHAGKPAKVAIMRKLVGLANALLKAGRSWMPKAA
ncbi:IS110 family transposase [Roseospira marina]|uniref:IS110 family transposase n=1 Tax=Roseospira marina TaxID=140057 RepID=A0A5M6IGF6_9PROT|nr:transposase [Roseospira marina]KAA5606849.1 IS110 family transposase [Roseospira marina]MBB4312984.1 transposase [Roseospira marina]MBB5086243.1 transposase [Roseospira marina]